MSLLNFSKLNMAEMDKDFDLLAGHELGEARINTNQDDEDPDKMDCLVWHKLDTVGYQPAAREVVLPYIIIYLFFLSLTYIKYNVIN